MTSQELLTAFGDGDIRITDSIECLSPDHASLVHQANVGNLNAAVALSDTLLGDKWLWHVGYDNRATLTLRGDTETVIAVISISPAHALGLSVLQAWIKDTLTSG